VFPEGDRPPKPSAAPSTSSEITMRVIPSIHPLFRFPRPRAYFRPIRQIKTFFPLDTHKKNGTIQ
jgi:hypothetical protein